MDDLQRLAWIQKKRIQKERIQKERKEALAAAAAIAYGTANASTKAAYDAAATDAVPVSTTVSFVSILLYIIYTGLIGISLFYATRLHTLIVFKSCDPSIMATMPILTPEDIKKANDALYLAISYTIILGVFVLSSIIYALKKQEAINPMMMAVFGFIVLLMQLSSFGILNQTPAYAFARERMGKEPLTAYQATNALGIVFSLFIIGMNGFEYYQRSRPPAIPTVSIPR